MNQRIQPRFLTGLFAILSGTLLFAIGDAPSLIDQLANYPNPFDSRREETHITYRLAQDLPVKVRIYDLFGYPVKEFSFNPGDSGARFGQNTIRWDGTDSSGQKVSKGGYICQIIVDGDQPVRMIRKIGVIH